MYDLLTFRELNVLQSMLYEGTEDAYKVVSSKNGNRDWVKHYHPVHVELGHLFIEAGTELLRRLDQQVREVREVPEVPEVQQVRAA